MKFHQLFFFLLLFLLPTQLGYHFWPSWAFILGRRVDYLSPTLYLTDVLIFFTLLFWFIESWGRIRGLVLSIKGFVSKILDTKYLILAMLFIGLNIFFAASRPVAVYKWLKVLEFIALGWYVYKTKPPLAKVTFFLSLGVIYSSGLAIIQFFLQRSVGGVFWFLGERTFSIDTPGIARIDLCHVSRVTCHEVLRPYATFPHPNVLGGYLAVVLPLILNLLIYPFGKLSAGKFPNLQMNRKMKKIWQWILIISFTLGIITLGLTFSRSAWIVAAVGISIMYYVLRQRKQKTYFSLILNTVALILLVLFVFNSFKPEDESVSVRGYLNQAAIMMWQGSPLVGVGLGNFLVALPKTLPTRTIYFLQPVHNIYLLLLAETGLVGLFFFAVIIFLIVKNYELRIRNYGRNKKSFLLVIRNSLFIILLLGLIDHYFLTLQQGQLLFTLFLALSL